MKMPPTHPAHWALPARAALLLLAALASSASGLGLYLQPGAITRDAALAHLKTLRTRVAPALARAARLPALHARHGLLVMQATAQTQQLWSQQDLHHLRDKLDRRATECGLSLESFRPLAAAANAARHDTPAAELSFGGSYGAMRCFVSRSVQTPWPVQFDGIDISPGNAADGQASLLRLQASVHAVHMIDLAPAAPPPSPGTSP